MLYTTIIFRVAHSRGEPCEPLKTFNRLESVVRDRHENDDCCVRAALVNAPQPARSCKSVLWFTGIRASLDGDYESLKVALLTAKANAPSLVPCLIWSGAASPVTAWFQRQGGRVFFHDLTFHAELPGELDGDTGAYLRLDVPLILSAMKPLAADVEPEHVLYTDPDVMFLNDFDGCSLPKPKVIAMGTQGFPGSQAKAAPGVMYMNASALAEHRDRLLEFGRGQKVLLGVCAGPDQGLLPAVADRSAAHALQLEALLGRGRRQQHHHAGALLRAQAGRGAAVHAAGPCEQEEDLWQRAHLVPRAFHVRSRWWCVLQCDAPTVGDVCTQS